MKITNKIRKEVEDYLEGEGEYFLKYPDEFYLFYYRCMKADMHCSDADRYAILNTMFGYDIGMDNAEKIDSWMYEHDEEIYELSYRDIELVKQAVTEIGLNLDFSKWIQEDYSKYKFFEEVNKRKSK